MSKAKKRSEPIKRTADRRTSTDGDPAANLDSNWRELLASEAYEFLDFGCPKGGSSAIAAQKLGLKSGLGIDPDPKRVSAARAAGANAVTGDVIGLEIPPGAVSAVIASNYLNRLSGADLVRQAVVSALDAARDFVLIRQPFFDANPQLLALGFELQSAERPGYSSIMTSDHIWRAARRQIEAGQVDLYILGRKQISNSADSAILTLNNARLINSLGGPQATPTPPIKFDFPVFAEMVAIIVKRSEIGPNADWQAISKALGCDRLLLQAAGGELSSSKTGNSSKTMAASKPNVSDYAASAAPSGQKETAAIRYLFVCGVARSGTTVLTEILNSHPQVSLGVERYKNLSNRGDEEFGPNLFHGQRFFDFRDGDTNVAMPKVYDMLRKKYDQSVYVGDKVPRYYRKIGKILEIFDPVKIVFISRDIQSVSFSWNERADNPKDSWPAENDFSKAVGEWNLGNKIALAAARKNPERVAIVNYDAIVKQGLAPTERLMNWLGLELAEEFRQAYQRIMTRAPAKKEKIPKPGQDALIAEHADDQTYQALRALAL